MYTIGILKVMLDVAIIISLGVGFSLLVGAAVIVVK